MWIINHMAVLAMSKMFYYTTTLTINEHFQICDWRKWTFQKLCQKLHRQILAQPLHGSGMGNVVQTLLYVTEPYLWILVTGITRRIGKGNQALYRKTEWDGFVLKYPITHHCFSGLFIRIMALSILKLPISPCSFPAHGACE